MTAPSPPAPLNRQTNHHCFGCGDDNPHGLRLKFYPRLDSDRGVYTDWTPTATEEGYVGMVHGGLISTVCDEVMAWTCYAEEIWGMTARLSVRFRQPVLVGQAYRATGWIVTSRGRMVDVAAAMHHRESGRLVAEATAQFLRVSDAQSTEWVRRYGDPIRS
jgi:acyl-coenzyme A thioesterase PaaI-like protein